MEILQLLILASSYFLITAADNVIELNDDDFTHKTAAYDTALVMFYAPW